jgi:aminopeptidase N
MTWAAEAGLEQSTACRYCSRNFASQLRPSASGRQYAPDRQVDLLHMKLDVTPDLKNRTIEGTCQLLFTPIAKPLRELVLSAVDLDVQSVTSNVKLAGYEMTSRGLEVAFQEPVEVGKRVELDIRYEAEPRKGLYFRTPELGFREQDTHIWTQGEPHESRHWFPSIDYPNERFTSEIICHVPSQWTVLSNGRLVEEVAEPAGRKRVHYHQEIPHVGYLVALAAGDFAKLEDKHENIPLGFYTPRSRARYARNGFRDTADILGFLEAEIGVPYPWSKYDQVVVEDYHMGGMENTSLTILNPIAVFPDESENLRDLYGLIAHELVHQWFGDYLTCKDWSELWLNEGFAVYYSYLYDGYKNGNDSMLLSVYNDRKGILYNKDETRPVVFRHYDKAWDQFDQRAYAKGGWILHMLRMQLGEDLFRRCVTHYVKKNALRSVDTHDLQEAFEDVSGLSLLPFFDQWVHHAGHPKLEVAYDWLPHEKLAKISVEQLQQARSGDKQGDPKKKNQQQLFDLPVTLRFVGPDYTVERSILIDKQMQDFYVPLPEKPEVVRFDAKMQVLGEIDFEKPKKMLYRQLKEQGDVVGRLLAADALGEKDDQKTIKQLQTALVEDPFFGVRIEAAKSLAKIGTPEALDALAASLAQHDARVRRQVVRDIGSFYHPRARAALIGVLANEKNPDIVADAIRPLGKYSDAEVADQIRALLPVSSYDNAVAGGAMDAIRKLDDPGYIPLMQQVIEREVDYPSKTFPASLDALAHVARDLEDRDQVLEFLMAYLNHPRERVQLAAISALGTLGDPRAMEIVRSFNTGPEGNRKKKAAIEALKKLRNKQKTPAALGELRGEVDKLREQNEKFRTEVEDLKDRLEAADSREEENQEAEQQND